MVEKTNKIKEYIDNERERLGEDLHEIEDRVRNATDLRQHYEKNTGLILGATVAGGFLLGMLVRASNNKSIPAESESSRGNRSGRRSISMSSHMHRVSESVDNIVAALAGVAAAKLSTFVSDIIPGFKEQYDRVEKNRSSSSVRQMPAV